MLTMIDNNSAQATTTPHRHRRPFTKAQQEMLEAVFISNHYPDIYERYRLAKRLQQPKSRIQGWFRNRRARLRRSMPDGCTCCSRSIDKRPPCDEDYETTLPASKKIVMDSTSSPAALLETPPSRLSGPPPFDNNSSARGIVQSERSLPRDHAGHGAISPLMSVEFLSRSSRSSYPTIPVNFNYTRLPVYSPPGYFRHPFATTNPSTKFVLYSPFV